MSQEILMKVGIFYIIALILAIVFRVAMTLCIGFSCKARAAKNQTAWMILTFFFPIIAPFIFLCVKDSIRKKCPKLCISCGATVHPDTIACPNCGNAVFQDYTVTEEQRYKKNSKTLLIVSIIVFVASIVFSVLTFAEIIKEVPPFDENSESYGYYDDFDDDYYDDYFDDYFDNYFNDFFN